jgi:parallel beta-helix repeat protein/predicted outer membrane repeat protein
MKMHKKITFCFFTLSLIWGSVTAFAASTIYVPGDYSNIQDAIDAADTSDTVVVADGTYTLKIGTTYFDFKGKAITVRSENGPDNCIIDCQNTDDARGFSFSNGEGPSSELSGFTFINTEISTIYIKSASPTISNCILSGNAMGIYVYSGSPLISNCTISDNTGYTKGGGIYISSGSPTITNCLISNNSASDAGGGVYNNSGSVTINDCTISNNSAENKGGGIYNASNLTLHNSKIFNNSVTSNDSYGGGCYLQSEDTTIVNCIIAGNSSPEGGGGVYVYYGDLSIINCTITENTSNSGGGLYKYGNSSNSVTIINSIYWNNTPTGIYYNSSLPEVYYSDIQGGFTGTANINQDPLLGNGYHITAGSPCIDAGTGDAGDVGDVPTTDIDGTSRPQGSGWDIGADETSGDNPNNPTANAGTDQVVGSEITLYGSESFDPDGSIESYQWVLRHRDNSLYNKTAVGETATVSSLKKGFYDVTLTVTDNSGATSSDEMELAAIGDPIKEFDINGDGKTGLEDTIHSLRILTGQE